MLKQLANICILGYQKHLSPHKGYVCAHAAYQGGHSCSEHVRQVVLTSGVIAGLSAFKTRTAECKEVYLQAQKEKEEDSSTAGEVAGDVATEGACVALEAGACISF